jgi:hypothetical protein
MSLKPLALALTSAFLIGSATPRIVEAQQDRQQAGQVNAGQLISALNNISVQINRLNALNDLTVQNVRVVNVEDVLRGANIEALNNALNRNNVEILNLRNVLNNNTVIQDVLNNADINISRVVSIDVLSGGDVIVFYQ